MAISLGEEKLLIQTCSWPGERWAPPSYFCSRYTTWVVSPPLRPTHDPKLNYRTSDEPITERNRNYLLCIYSLSIIQCNGHQGNGDKNFSVFLISRIVQLCWFQESFSLFGFKNRSAFLVSRIVQPFWFQESFSLFGFKNRSAFLVSRIVQPFWFSNCSAFLVSRIVQPFWFSNFSFKNCSAFLVLRIVQPFWF